MTNEELAALRVEFPRLSPDSAEGCPQSMDDIQAYLKLEDADGDAAETRDLTFVRTALVDDTKYWLWEYRETDGEQCFVTVAFEKNGRNTLGMNGNWDGLTPEQFILGDYREMF